MKISVEISYYTLQNDYNEIIEQFISRIQKSNNIEVEIGSMSSIISGNYEETMNFIQLEMKPFIEKYPSVFLLKISNACSCCKT